MKDLLKGKIECELILNDGMLITNKIPIGLAIFLDSKTGKNSITVKISTELLEELFETIGMDKMIHTEKNKSCPDCLE